MYGIAAPKPAQMSTAQCYAKWEHESIHGSHIESLPKERLSKYLMY